MTNDQSELSAWLAELEAEQAARAVVIASIKNRLGITTDAPSPIPKGTGHAARPAHDTPSGPLRGDSFFGMNVPDAIRKYLAMTKRPQSPKQITAALRQGGVLSQAADFYANVSTSLKRLREQELVVNTAEGWGLAEWYAGRPRQSASKPTRKSRVEKKTETARHKAPRPKLLTSGNPGGWHQFLGEAAKRGKTMAEAAEEWKALRSASTQ